MKKVLIPLFAALIMLTALMGLMNQSALAETSDLTTDIYLYNDDGQIHAGEVLTTALAFTTQSNVFNFTDQSITATVVFEGFGPEWNPTFDHGSSVSGDFEYDPDAGTAVWNGAIPAQSVGEFWAHSSDNVSWETTSWFTVSLDLDGAAQAARLGVYNPNPEPPPPPVTFSTHVYADDGTNTVGAGEILTTETSYTAGFALYHDSADPVTATITLLPYSEVYSPTAEIGNGLTGEFTCDAVTEICTWSGILNPSDTPSDFWLSIENNAHFSQTIEYQMSWEAEGQQGTEIVSVYNPAEPPPPPTTEFKVYLPLVNNQSSPGSDEEPVLSLDVTASDGENSSRDSGGVLTTSKSFAVNLAAYSLVEEALGTTTVTFSGFDPAWNTTPGQEPGFLPNWTKNPDGSWTWSGTLETGIMAVSEFWVNSPAVSGQHEFTVTVEIEGRLLTYAGHVTVIVP
ncbi:hypothetical protein C4561_03295 [candidate division WWE3 bacterium]|jgi:hypothetical protein|uniref:Uncharacterized protein n=1 Tax=candidate division WWE3 bacterium TaxID=2053526 RepID=A0A3A4ZD44_UNCKA|nr:MAG: hypothetical protein C4561_03295 [candidate division WWE3 bacterium]